MLFFRFLCFFCWFRFFCLFVGGLGAFRLYWFWFLSWLFILFFFIAGIFGEGKGISNRVEVELLLLKLLSFESSLYCLNVRKLSSEFFLSVKGHNVVLPFLDLFFSCFRFWLCDNLFLGFRHCFLLLLWLFWFRFVIVTGNISPTVDGFVILKVPLVSFLAY